MHSVVVIREKLDLLLIDGSTSVPNCSGNLRRIPNLLEGTPNESLFCGSHSLFSLELEYEFKSKD